MGDQVGSIAEGKQADLVIFSGTSPSMIAAAQHNPVAAVILHSSPADIEHVVIDGILRKRAGRLVDVEVEKQSQEFVGQQKLAWENVAKEVITRREVLQKKIEKIDMAAAMEAIIDQWHLDRSKLADSL